MVETTFDERLKICLRRAGVPARDWRKYIRKHFEVSEEMARRYLCGAGIPKGERMRKMAVHFAAPSEWMETGRGEPPGSGGTLPIPLGEPPALYQKPPSADEIRANYRQKLSELKDYCERTGFTPTPEQWNAIHEIALTLAVEPKPAAAVPDYIAGFLDALRHRHV